MHMYIIWTSFYEKYANVNKAISTADKHWMTRSIETSCISAKAMDTGSFTDANNAL